MKKRIIESLTLSAECSRRIHNRTTESSKSQTPEDNVENEELIGDDKNNWGTNKIEI